MPRPFLVSNRLPVRVVQHEDDDAVDVVPSAGGVATALREVQRERGARWLGWPGDVPAEHKASVARALDDLGAIPVFLSREDSRRFYERFSSGVLWPLLHGNIDKVPLDIDEDWRTYKRVNQMFADEILAHLDGGKSGDELLWVHDFQLALVPEMIRRRAPDAAVGFFLHVPFPPTDVFRVLPWRREWLAGILGADVVGVHTAGYADNLLDAARKLLGARVDAAAGFVTFAGHTAHVVVAPISVDVDRLERAARDPGVRAQTAALRAEAHGKKLLLGVDRLDYTKGIPARLLAVERLLDTWPELAPQCRFVQVAVPTREQVDVYAEFRKQIEALVGRINGKHGTPTGVPIHFMYREVPFDELVALYCAADVMVVTPFRDGMNLVSKEYCAARVDEQGALILSELAGAADELDGALVINPYDIGGMAAHMKLALAMPEEEQRVRMSGMRRTLHRHDVRRWARDLLAELEAVGARRGRNDGALAQDLARAAAAPSLDVILDYDGTLVPIEATPGQAAPDDEIHDLLAALAADGDTRVHVVSGRGAATLDAWLGDLPVWLHAEHGAHARSPARAWDTGAVPRWKAEAAHALEVVAAQAPGAFVEVKPSSVALHVRCVPRESRDALVRGAAHVLERMKARAEGLAVLVGDCVVEARRADANKARIVETLPAGSLVFAAGDDTTDDDLFGALRGDAVTIAVGPRPQRARHRLRDAWELRALLHRLAGARARARGIRRDRAPR